MDGTKEQGTLTGMGISREPGSARETHKAFPSRVIKNGFVT